MLSFNRQHASVSTWSPTLTNLRVWPNAWASFVFSLFAFCLSADLKAEEPFKKFLSRLEEEGLYEYGLKYLDLAASKSQLPDSIKADLPLERIFLLQESLVSIKNPQQREDRIAVIEKGYKDFLAASADHPRRSEAQTKLGDLLLQRAKTAEANSKKETDKTKSDEWLVKSRSGHTEVLELNQRILQELKPLLEALKGDKVKPNNAAGKALRDRYQAEYRQAQIMSAVMMESIGKTYPAQAPEWKSWLEKSEAEFTQIIEKTAAATEAGRRMLCLFYRGGVQVLLGKTDEARESFTRVSENEGAGIFRTWRVQAIAGIVRIESSEKVGKYEVAIERGEELLKQATANDKNEAEWIDLQLAIAEARVAFAPKIDTKDNNKVRNNRNAARELCKAILKKQSIPNPSIAEAAQKAKTMLAGLGIEIEEKVDIKLPDSRNFDDSMKAARERLNRAEELDTTTPLLAQQLAAATEADKPAVQQQLDTTNADILRDRQQGIELFRRALKQRTDKESRDDLLEARFLLSYLLLRTDQHWEATAIAQDLIVSARGTEKADKAGSFARMGLSKLLIEATPEQQLQLMVPLEQLAKKLIALSTESADAQESVDLLVKLSLIHKRLDKARQYVAMNPAKGGSGASILGQLLWADYRKAIIKHRADKTEPTPEELDVKTQAENLLQKTWAEMDPAKADKNLVSGVNTLATMYLASDRIDDALNVLEEKTRGAIALSESVQELDSNTKLEAGRILLQAWVQAAGAGKRPLVAANVAALVAKMKVLSAGNDALLTASLRNLAIELQSKLDATKDPAEQVRLAEAFGLLIEQLVTVSSDIGTLDSTASAILQIASDMIKSPTLSANGKKLMGIAESAFAKIASKPETDLIAANRKPEEIQLKLGKAKRGAGNYKEASEVFLNAIKKSPTSNLTLQVEAARNFQMWSGGKDAELLKKAMQGAEPNEKKVNTIWGWGQIANITSKRINDFEGAFFEARYNIADCRKQIAATQSADIQKKTYERAIEDIRQTIKTYPELGGDEWKPKFAKLTQELQQVLGKPVLGLNEFASPNLPAEVPKK
jgi:hypothetical protein